MNLQFLFFNVEILSIIYVYIMLILYALIVRKTIGGKSASFGFRDFKVLLLSKKIMLSTLVFAILLSQNVYSRN